MYQVNNFFNNDDVKVISELGPFKVMEYQRDLSVMPSDAMLAYYCNEMNVRKRQVVCQVGPTTLLCRQELCSGLLVMFVRLQA